MYSIVLELVVHEFIVSAFLCSVQRCKNPHKTFFSYYDLTFAKVPHAEIPFQCLFFFFLVQSQTCTQTQKPLCIASCFKYCDSTMCCPFSAWAKDLCSVSGLPSSFFIVPLVNHSYSFNLSLVSVQLHCLERQGKTERPHCHSY